MSLSELANLIYQQSQVVKIDYTNSNEAIFTRPWLIKYHSQLLNTSGWYWLSTTMSFNEFSSLVSNNKKKKKGCKVSEVATKSKAIFSEDLLCKTHFYNGHADKLVSRLRNHFYLQNDSTGALGLNAYDVFKGQEVKVYYFAANMIEDTNLTIEQKALVKQLISFNIGRTAIENAWRSDNGFPILCKH